MEINFLIKDVPPSRWIVIVPKTLLKKATDRNLLRRQIHEYLRINIAKKTLPHDGILRVRQVTAIVSAEKTHRELDDLFIKARLMT